MSVSGSTASRSLKSALKNNNSNNTDFSNNSFGDNNSLASSRNSNSRKVTFCRPPGKSLNNTHNNQISNNTPLLPSPIDHEGLYSNEDIILNMNMNGSTYSNTSNNKGDIPSQVQINNSNNTNNINCNNNTPVHTTNDADLALHNDYYYRTARVNNGMGYDEEDGYTEFNSPYHNMLLSTESSDGDTTSIDTDPDTESDIDDPEIPYSSNGHLQYHPFTHLSYEYYRNPQYHDLFPAFFSLTSSHTASQTRSNNTNACTHRLHRWISSFFTIPRVERINIVSSQQRILKQHQLEYSQQQQHRRAAELNNNGNNNNYSINTTSAPFNSPLNTNTNNNNKSTTKPTVLSPKDNYDYNTNLPQPPAITTSNTPIYDLNDYDDEDLEKSKNFCDWPQRAEMFIQLSLAVPLIISFLAQYALGLINLYFQSQISEQSLASMSVAVMFSNVCGNAMIYGINASLDTLGANSFGAKKYKLIGLYALRGLTIALLLNIFIAFSWWYSYYPLYWILGIEEGLAVNAQAYLRWTIPALPAITIFDIARRYLEVQCITWPSMIVNLLSVLLAIPLNILFMKRLDYGFIGAAFSFNIVNWVMVFVLIIYIRNSGVLKYSWPKRTFSIELFRGWGLYLKFGIPAMLTIASEWILFEIMLIITSRLKSNAAIAAQNIITTLNATIFSISLCIGISGSIRIGSFLGARKTAAALHAYYVSLRLLWCASLTIGLTIFCFSKQIAGFFIGDNSLDTRQIVEDIFPFFSVFCIVDAWQGCLAQIFRGLGKQNYSVCANLLGYWAVGLPLAVVLGLKVGTHHYPDFEDEVRQKGYGLIGQWVALLIVSIGVVASYLSHLSLMSWSRWEKTLNASLVTNNNNTTNDDDNDDNSHDDDDISNDNHYHSQRKRNKNDDITDEEKYTIDTTNNVYASINTTPLLINDNNTNQYHTK